MSYSRQMRRAAERRAQKEARKQERAAACTAETSVASVPEVSDDQFLNDLLVRELEKAKDEPIRTGPTGPRTPEGKAISSLNNLKHGLTGAFRVLEFESQSDFDAAHSAFAVNSARLKRSSNRKTALPNRMPPEFVSQTPAPCTSKSTATSNPTSKHRFPDTHRSRSRR